MTGKPTLKTIAELSGFAVPTVSRALGDAPDISETTKKTVRRIAKEIGYIPNRAGVRLRTGRTNVVGLVLSAETTCLDSTSLLISSIAMGMRNTPFHLVVIPDFADDDVLKPIKYIVESGSADAIIFNRTRPDDTRIKYLMERGFPFVTHGRSLWAEKHAYFDYDNDAFGRLSVELLAERGRKHILIIAPPHDQNYGLEFVAGARAAAAQYGVEVVLTEGITGDSHRDVIQPHIAALLDSGAQFDGLISATSNSAMAVIPELEKVGFEIGKNFDVVSKETMPLLTLFRPGIIAINEDIESAGAFLARAAVHAARLPDEAPMQCLDVPKKTS